MTVLLVLASAFLILESLNIAVLWFAPGFTRGNALGGFRAWESSQKDPEVHELVRYLAAWVAASKFIFVVVVATVLVVGDDATRVAAVAALGVGILAYFWRLRPLIAGIDRRGALSPAGYSRKLTIGIAALVALLGAAVVSGWSTL